ncbi:MAG: hypothetical protein KBA66_07410 [Leptospiraceae bacterium]|nr:hypothetical protein [Leptospiraceae bacterium]
MAVSIDFSKWPKNTHSPNIFDLELLNKKYYLKLENYPITKKHIQCLLRFIWHCAVQKEMELIQYREGYLRAALMEFAILEDSLNDECILYKENKFKFYNRNEPIFHLLKMLRNTQIHLRNINLGEEKYEYLWGGNDEDGKPRIWQGKIYVSQDLNSSDLDEWDGKKKKLYSEEQIAQLLTWFNLEQKSFGIQNLIYLGMNCFIDILP